MAGSAEVDDMVARGSLFWQDEVQGVSSGAEVNGTLFESEGGPTVDESGAMEHPAASMSGGLAGESGPLLA